MVTTLAAATAQERAPTQHVRLEQAGEFQVLGGVIRSVAADPTGEYLALGSALGDLQLVRSENGERVWMRSIGKGSIGCMAFTPDGESLVACVDRLHVIEVATGRDRSVLTGMNPSDLALSTEGTSLGIVGRSPENTGVFELLDLATWRRIDRHEFPGVVPTRIAADPGGSGWTVSAGEKIYGLGDDGTPNLRLELQRDSSFDGQCVGLGWVGSPDVPTLVGLAWSGRLRLGDRTIARSNGIYMGAFSPTRARWASYGPKEGLVVWDADGTILSQHDVEVSAMCFTAGGSQLVVTTRTAQLMWVQDGELRTGFGVSAPGHVRSLAFSRDGKFLIASEYATTIADLDAGTRRVVPAAGVVVPGRGGSEFGLVADARIRLFDARSGQPRAEFEDAEDAEFDDATLNAMGALVPQRGSSILLQSLAVSSTGMRAEARGWQGSSGSIRVTERDGTVVFEQDGFHGALHSASFSPSGDRLVLTESIGDVDSPRSPRVWELDTRTFQLNGVTRPKAPTMRFLTDRWLIGTRCTEPIDLHNWSARQSREVVFWDADRLREGALDDGVVLLAGGFDRVVFSPDGRRLAVEREGLVRVFEIGRD